MSETDPYYIKIYIVREVSFLSQENKRVIRDIILQNDQAVIKEYPDGLRCNLNLLNSKCVDQIYTYMKNIINTK